MKKFLLQSLVVMAVAAFGLRNELQQVLQTPLQFPAAYYEVKAGSNLSALCRQWQQTQQMSALDCQLLKLQSLLQPQLRQLKAGVYAVQPMSLQQFLQLARSGKVAQFILNCIVGFNSGLIKCNFLHTSVFAQINDDSEWIGFTLNTLHFHYFRFFR